LEADVFVGSEWQGLWASKAVNRAWREAYANNLSRDRGK
jgi:hypothetical protein